MGCAITPVPPHRPTELQTPYVENLSRIQEFLKPRFFIFTDCSLDEPILKQISKQLPTIALFKSLGELTQFTDDYMNNHLLVIFSQNTYIKQLLPNYAAFQTIAFAHTLPMSNSEIINEKPTLMYGYRFAGLFLCQIPKIKAYISQASRPRSLLFCTHDQGLINRTLANSTFILQNDEPSPETFKQYLSAQGEPGTKLVKQIETHLAEQNPKIGKFLVDEIAGKNPCLLAALQLFKQTSNPGILAHGAWFYKALHNYIRISYTHFLKSPNRTQLYFVVQPSQAQNKFLEREQNFMMSTFWVGYTDKQDALKEKNASHKNYLFIVNLPQILVQNSVDIDFGFCEFQGCAIFSIGTFFRVDEVDHTERYIRVTSGVLGSECNYRKEQPRYMQKAKHENKCMMRLFDYLKMQRSRLKDQIYLLLHLQYYHTFKDFVRAEFIQQQPNSTKTISPNKAKLNNTLPTAASNSAVNSLVLPSSARIASLPAVFREGLADALSGIGDVQQAEEIYKRLQNGERALLKQISMFDRWGKQDRFMQLLEKIPQITVNEKTSLQFLQIAQASFNAVHLASRGSAKEARDKSDCFKQMDAEFRAQYISSGDLHEDESITAFPLYSVVIHNASRVARMVGNRSDAQNWERQYKNYWSFFDGTHVQWLP